MDRRWPAGTGPVYTAADVAVRTGLPIPKVRFYAALYGDFLGAAGGPLDEWRFGPDHLPFFHALAQGLPPAAALRAAGTAAAAPPPDNPLPNVPPGLHAREASPPTPSAEGLPPAGAPAVRPAGTDLTSGRTASPGAGAAAAAETADGRASQPTSGSLADLTERVDELSWQVQDLLEETKQVQILLSKAIRLLEDMGTPTLSTAQAPLVTAAHGTPGAATAPTPGNAGAANPAAHAQRPASAAAAPQDAAATVPHALAAAAAGPAFRAAGTPPPAGVPSGRGFDPTAVPPAVIREAALGDDVMRTWEPQAF